MSQHRDCCREEVEMAAGDLSVLLAPWPWLPHGGQGELRGDPVPVARGFAAGLRR